MVMLLPHSLGDDLSIDESWTCGSKSDFWDFVDRMRTLVESKAKEGWHVIDGHEPTMTAAEREYRFTCKLTRWTEELPECEDIMRAATLDTGIGGPTGAPVEVVRLHEKQVRFLRSPFRQRDKTGEPR